MARHRVAVTGFLALALAAAPCAAQAAQPGVITSDTTLKFGQKGTFNLDGWDPNSEKYKARKSAVAVRVLKIDKGKASDLKGHGLPASATGMVPYYIRSELSYAGAEFHGSPPLFGGEFSDGSGAASLITSDAIGPCADTSTITVGKKHRTALDCTTVLAPAKVAVVKASFFYSVDKHRSVKVTWTKTGK